MSRTNSYVIKFQVNGKFNPFEIFWSYLKIQGVTSNTQPKEIYEHVIDVCLADIKKYKGVDIDRNIVDVQLLSLVDSFDQAKEMFHTVSQPGDTKLKQDG